MTTIAADAIAGVMCSDSFWFAGDECGTIRKVFRVHGSLVGIAGDVDHIIAWRTALKANKPLPKVDVTVLRLGTQGLDCWTSGDGWHKVEAKQYAIGGGGKAARGALAAGASCAKAVRIAAGIDAQTGGPVRTYRLGK